MQIADMNKANRYWKANKFERWPETIAKAIDRAENIAREHPEWLQEKPFRKPKSYKCKFCKSADGFEVVPMEKVYKLLKYTE
jgi:hypothetical protein